MTPEELKIYFSEGFEIKYLPVGDSSHGGDAILIRFGNLQRMFPDQKIIVIDGGYTQDGKRISDTIKNDFKSDKIDLIISTHPDKDHACGLRTVIESDIEVEKVLMHRPWKNVQLDSSLFKDKRKTDDSINEEFKSIFNYAHDIEEIIIKKYGNDHRIIEPRIGMDFFNGVLKILGPENGVYVSKILESSKTSEPAQHTGISTENGGGNVISKYENETLENPLPWPNDPETAAINDTSVVTFFEFCGKRVLFTGDSGLTGLYNVLEYAKANDIDLKNLDAFDIPHHGSRKNLNPKFIDYLKPKIALLSAPKDSSRNHPSQKLINEFYRQNIPVYSTQGKTLYYSKNAPDRNLSKAKPLEFIKKVDI